MVCSLSTEERQSPERSKPGGGRNAAGGRPESESRARVIEFDVVPPIDHPALTEVTARVEYIATLMERGVWHSRRTKRELSEVWEQKESTIQNYSAEAGRSLEAGLREGRVARAHRAAERLERIAIECAGSSVPGDAGAAVRANEVLLKMTGYSEPEEDKQRGSTVVVLGQLATSPAMRQLVSGDVIDGHSDEEAEVAEELPEQDRDGAVVPRRRQGAGVD